MLELIPSLTTWLPTAGAGPLAVATIISAEGSVPRPVGTSMLVSAAGAVLGSLSGGCVEGAVIEAALETMDSRQVRTEHFGYGTEDAFAAGLTCGGSLEVHIQPYPCSKAGAGSAASDSSAPSAGPGSFLGLAGLASVPAGSPAGRPALIRRLDDGAGAAVVVPLPQDIGEAELCAELVGMLGTALARSAARQLVPMLHGGQSGLVRLAPQTEPCTDNAPTLLLESQLPPARMLIFGANDFGAALLPAAQLLGYHVTLCDARPVFVRQERFRSADVVVDWPHRYLRTEAEAGRIDARSVVCVLSHDPKFDVPLLHEALGLELAYLGAMGSRQSHRDRVTALLAAGADPEKLARLHAPIGLDLGAVTPAEVAVSITAEIVACRSSANPSGPSGPATTRSLRDGTGAIHRTTPAAGTAIPGALVSA
ncbi:MAG TPA: XdhC family protein [Micrococcaceae bacterium]|jgi:xanthine dehydrogenase accessory factor|nr:XdhC family protein [Micrococcaceae bacterium]